MSHSLQHPSDIELLLANDGELDSPRHAIVEAHIAGCAACRTKSTAIASTLTDATATCTQRLDPPAWTHQQLRVRFESHLRDTRNEWEQSWTTRIRAAFAPAAVHVGAGVALAIMVLAMWMPRALGNNSTPHQDRLPLASLPIATLTPGAVAPLSASELCNGARPARVVTERSQQAVLRSYGMERVPGDEYELDALITPELGGTTDPANLWPQRYASPVWNAAVKDELERLLPELVCSGQLDLARAQQDIATDWIGAYKRYFKTTTPLHGHSVRRLDDIDELIFESRSRLRTSPLHLVGSAIGLYEDSLDTSSS